MGYLKLTNGEKVIEITGKDIHIPPGNWTVMDADGVFAQIQISNGTNIEFSGDGTPFVKYDAGRTVLSFEKSSVIPSWWVESDRKRNRKNRWK
jgi:hypothetical protein